MRVIIEQHCSPTQAIKLMREHGYTTAQARAVLSDTLVSLFIDEACYATEGASEPFSYFYLRFMDWLPRDERPNWSRIRVSRSLPPQHPCGPMTNNTKHVGNLSFSPSVMRQAKLVKNNQGALRRSL